MNFEGVYNHSVTYTRSFFDVYTVNFDGVYNILLRLVYLQADVYTVNFESVYNAIFEHILRIGNNIEVIK